MAGWRRALHRLRPGSLASRFRSRELYRAVDPLIYEVTVPSAPWEAYEAANRVCGELGGWLTRAYDSGSLYTLWSELTDLFEIDGPGGAIPVEHAHALLVRAAHEWLATPPRLRRRYLRRWVSYDLSALAS